MLAIALAGCGTTRYVAQPRVSGVGHNISTRNRYKIVDYLVLSKGTFVKTKFDQIKSDMERLYPDVFGDDGIPFVLRQYGSYDAMKEGSAASGLLFLCTGFIFPIIERESIMAKYSIEFVRDNTITKGWDTLIMEDSAMGAWTPIPLMMYNSAPTGLGDYPFFWESTKNVGEMALPVRYKLNRQAIAYAAAVKLKELEDAGKIDVAKLTEIKKDANNSPVHPLPVPPPSTPLYNILTCERESGSDFAYQFVLELTGKDKSLRAFRSVQREFRAAVKEDYVESFPSVDSRSLFVDFPEYKLDNGKITGRAVVLTISVASLTYDPNTRTGKLAVKVNANQYEEARKWIRKNIETLARDKNIALTTGEIPPAAKFYLGREELKDGNVLEIEFKTE
jgi:hypothetical protein